VSGAGVLSVEGLTVRGAGAPAPVVDDVSFQIGPGERLGVVGESGSGKTMTALAVLGLVPAAMNVGGAVRFNDVDLVSAPARYLREVRGKQIAMVFQDPLTALSPVITVGKQIRDRLIAHEKVAKAVAKRRAIDMMGLAGVPQPARRYDEYPHQLSGGLRQRCMIAAALICEPDVLIADEPTSALDPTIQDQIIALIDSLTDARNMSVLFISHDLHLVTDLCDRVVTMYAGQIVDVGLASEITDRQVPRHPYTQALLACTPSLELAFAGNDIEAIPGQPPALDAMPSGCRFSPRCQHSLPECDQNPQVLTLMDRGRAVRCWRTAEREAALPQASAEWSA
jgi:peptide/nickel transport system ATP-binding protein